MNCLFKMMEFFLYASTSDVYLFQIPLSCTQMLLESSFTIISLNLTCFGDHFLLEFDVAGVEVLRKISPLKENQYI